MILEEEEEEQEKEVVSSEYETYSKEEKMGMAMVKLVFDTQSECDTIIVLETIHKDLQIQKNLEVVANTAEIEADNKLNETEEYKARKPREYTRIKIDREDRDEILRKGKRLKKLGICLRKREENGRERI
uniref:Uncharacterized protein n=1 Tax=Lactuca sativa TaxID=4236 RepID=A0A9R1XKZ0_LACSA|nr:hypothetical protein LSAT_V11C300144040 [Lactuca sativa]